MARKRPLTSSGTLVVLEYTSKVLAGNPLGDPHVRSLGVWLPPDYDRAGPGGRGRRYPVLYDLVGFTGSGLAHVNWKPFGENVIERAARLIHEKKMGPAILVFPDCFTCLGGNQYINSSAIGRYADYLTREIIPFVDREFRTLASREHRGCFGKSSGGYGAIIHGMKYAQHWGADRRSLGRRLFRLRLPARLAEHAERAREIPRAEGARGPLRRARRNEGAQGARQRPRRRPRAPFPRSGMGEGEALARRRPRDHEHLHGGELRSRSARRRSASGCRSIWRRARCSTRAGSAGSRTTRSTSSAATARTCVR